MTEESNADPYGEGSIQILSFRASVLKRPGMYFGDLQDGSAYAGTIRDLVHAALSWQIGANVGVKLKSDNAVELYCYSGLPQGQKAQIHRWSRPVHIVTREIAFFGAPTLDYYSIACGQMKWEIRDQFASGTAIFEDGLCRSAVELAPDLPDQLCLRVLLTIGSSTIHIEPATLAQVARAIRYLNGSAEAGYWGCVSIKDLRTQETLDVLVTDPPLGPNWLKFPDGRCK